MRSTSSFSRYLDFSQPCAFVVLSVGEHWWRVTVEDLNQDFQYLCTICVIWRLNKSLVTVAWSICKRLVFMQILPFGIGTVYVDVACPSRNLSRLVTMASYLWRKYADYLYTKWERTLLWDMVEPYRRPKSFTPLVTLYVLAFYTGVIGSAITEQLYKEKYWEDHPGEAVPIMRPKFYGGPWKILKGDVPPPGQWKIFS